MPDYSTLRFQPERARIVAGLQRLRGQLDAQVPPTSLDTTLRLATWNVREFDSPRYGPRVGEPFFYLAEVISRFDLVALQEVRRDLSALETLVEHLGHHWRFLVSDTTEGRAGNDERLAYLYDTRKVRFTGMAGELVLPPVEREDGTTVPAAQVVRTPFSASFQCGWVRFQLATVHILYGESRADLPARVEEIRAVAQFLADRAKDGVSTAPNLVILGDFNIFDRSNLTMRALTDAGWTVPKPLQELPGTNVPKDKFYDQIAFLPVEHAFVPAGPAGVFDFYESVYRDADHASYAEEMPDTYERKSDGTPRTDDEKRAYFRTYWRTYQMSDHLPMWVDLLVDYADDHLADLAD
jgi:endonuclease/exonuclease/phosphatase family metal-dependent hydrolase